MAQRARSETSSGGWSKTSLLGIAAVVALAAVGVALVASSRAPETAAAKATSTSAPSQNGGSTSASTSNSAKSSTKSSTTSSSGGKKGAKTSSGSESPPGHDQETLEALSKLYYESRNDEPTVEVVRQSIVELNSKDIQRLGLAPGSSWGDFNKDVDKIMEKDESAKVVYHIRHGEGDHNQAEREYGSEKWENEIAKTEEFLDAKLNEVGRNQCKDLQKSLMQAAKDGLKIDAIIVSPMTRAIETAQIGLGDHWGKAPIYAVEMCRERFGKNMCDKRRSIAELKKDFPEVNFDYFMEDSEDDPWFSPIRESDEHIEKRIAIFYNWLIQTPWKHIVVAGHSSYMAHSTKVLKAPYHWPANAELVPLTIHKNPNMT